MFLGRFTSYKYRIYPTKEQEVFFARSFGCVRWVYNWGLAYKISVYEQTKKCISAFSLMKEMTTLKRMDETIFLKEVNSQSLQQSLCNLDIAYTRFFKEKKGFPKFKNKYGKQSFSNPQDTKIDLNKNLVYIPKIKNGIKIVLHRKFVGKIKTSTITKTPSGKYFISILVEELINNPNTLTPKEAKTLGIDLGIKHFATLSDGIKIENPKHLKKRLKQLKHQQRKLSKKKKGSKNRDKQRRKVAILHEKVANCRKDFLHKLTKSIAENQSYTSVAIEDLNVQEMAKTKSKYINRAVNDVGWGMFKKFLQYKCEWYGKNLLVIGEFEPSSKLCTCGNLNHTLKLSDREWTCQKCGVTHDRDILAANNIKRFAFCKQNTSKISVVGQELPEFTLGENGVNHSLNQELSMSLS